MIARCETCERPLTATWSKGRRTIHFDERRDSADVKVIASAIREK
jgi:hypothetical protein